MLNDIVAKLGGYDGWQLITIGLGAIAVGMLLRMKWWFTAPIPLLGVVILALLLQHKVDTISATGVNSFTLAVASCIPIIFGVAGALTVIEPRAVLHIFGVPDIKANK